MTNSGSSAAASAVSTSSSTSVGITGAGGCNSSRSDDSPPVVPAAPMPDLSSQPLDPDEPTYCLCQQVSFGEMIGCDNDEVCLFVHVYIHRIIEFCCIQLYKMVCLVQNFLIYPF